MVFSEQVHVFIDACDIMLTKPGGLSSTEAAVKNVAVVHTEPISGCEKQNARFFPKMGCRSSPRIMKWQPYAMC